MKKHLIFDSEAYYYQYIDAEDGTPIYDGDDAELKYRDEHNIPYTKLGNWECDYLLRDEDWQSMIEMFDEAKHEKYPRREKKVKIYANLGLWDGRHKCEPVEEDTFSDAISRCVNGSDAFEVYQAGKWTVYIDAHHHDGTNRFKLTCYL